MKLIIRIKSKNAFNSYFYIFENYGEVITKKEIYKLTHS